MKNPSTQPFGEHISPWKLLIITLVSSLLGFQLIGIFIGVLVALPFYDGSLMDLQYAISDPVNNPTIRIPLMIMQGVGSAFGLILIPWLIYTKFFKWGLNFGQTKANWKPIMLVFLIVIFFMGINSVVGEWNQNIELPSSFSYLEQAMQAMEENMKVLTEMMTGFTSFGELILGLLIIAIIPAIGEELVFRGLIQNHIMRITNNIHLAIWFAGFIFGAIHMQFYGLFPRMLLGVLFGYLYYYSGKLSYAIIAHFVNNGVAVVAVYLNNIGKFDFDIDSTESLPWYQVTLSAGVLVVLFFTFVNTVKQLKLNE